MNRQTESVRWSGSEISEWMERERSNWMEMETGYGKRGDMDGYGWEEWTIMKSCRRLSRRQTEDLEVGNTPGHPSEGDLIKLSL